MVTNPHGGARGVGTPTGEPNVSPRETDGNPTVIGSSRHDDMTLTKAAEAHRLKEKFESGVDLNTFQYWEIRNGQRTEGVLEVLPSGQILVRTHENPPMYRVPSEKAINDSTELYGSMYARYCHEAKLDPTCVPMGAILARYAPKLLDKPAPPQVSAAPLGAAPAPVHEPIPILKDDEEKKPGDHTRPTPFRKTVEAKLVFKDVEKSYSSEGTSLTSDTEIRAFAKTMAERQGVQKTIGVQCVANTQVINEELRDKEYQGFLSVKQDDKGKVSLAAGAGDPTKAKLSFTAPLAIEGNPAGSAKRDAVAFLQPTEGCHDPFFGSLAVQHYEVRKMKTGYLLRYQAFGAHEVYCRIP